MDNGAIIYSGPSLIDGKSIVVIVTGLVRASSNVKTGGMLQTYILRADISPLDAVKTGDDVSICGGCTHRGRFGTVNGIDRYAVNRTCYVNLGQGPRAVYNAFTAGNYRVAPADTLATLAAGRSVRLGTYGDPAAVPASIWIALISQSIGHTGYTHQWRSARVSEYRPLLQASCETERDVLRANTRQWGTFRVLPVGAEVPMGIHCPASSEAGKSTSCTDCRMCNGKDGLNIFIHVHGPSRKKYLPVLA